MGFSFRKKDKVIDLTDYHRKKEEKIQNLKEEFLVPEKQEQPSGIFGFFGNNQTNLETQNNDSDAEEKRKRLAKRLADMTEKLEDISNQMYHMQQRIEVIEKKMRINEFN